MLDIANKVINNGIGESITSNKLGGKLGIIVNGHDKGFIK